MSTSRSTACGSSFGSRRSRASGLYVPGGTARYPSSVLMTAMPAKVAGVRDVVMVTPGASPEALLAARIARVDRVFEIGGAQAVAALAYGTETIPRVDKIVGPGNAWVASAKRQVYGEVDIDSIAGPSEVLVIADEGAPAAWIAADLIAQAEHDREARAVLVTTSAALATAVAAELERQLADAAAARDRRARAHSPRRGGDRRIDRRRDRTTRIDSRPSISSCKSTARAKSPLAARPRARSSSGGIRPKPRATISPARTTCCRPAVPRAMPRHSGCVTSASERRSSSTTPTPRRPTPTTSPRLPPAKASTATADRP